MSNNNQPRHHLQRAQQAGINQQPRPSATMAGDAQRQDTQQSQEQAPSRRWPAGAFDALVTSSSSGHWRRGNQNDGHSQQAHNSNMGAKFNNNNNLHTGSSQHAPKLSPHLQIGAESGLPLSRSQQKQRQNHLEAEPCSCDRRDASVSRPAEDKHNRLLRGFDRDCVAANVEDHLDRSSEDERAGHDEYAEKLRGSHFQQMIGFHQHQHQHEHQLQHQQAARQSQARNLFSSASLSLSQPQMQFAAASGAPTATEIENSTQARLVQAAVSGQAQLRAPSQPKQSQQQQFHVNFNQSSQRNGLASNGLGTGVDFANDDDGEGESTRKKKYLTAKYGQQQMNLIKKRLKIEMWLHEQLQELAKQSKSADPDELDDIDIDLDQLLDMDDDHTRRNWLRKTLAPIGDLPQESLERFICDVLDQSKLL